jgi:hypothetical protein
MGRKPTGRLPGRSSAFTGEKLEYLLTKEKDFRTLPRSQFYDDVTKGFIVRYGFDLAWEENIPGMIEDWSVVDAKACLSGDELEERKQLEDKKFQELRDVSSSQL